MKPIILISFFLFLMVFGHAQTTDARDFSKFTHWSDTNVITYKLDLNDGYAKGFPFTIENGRYRSTIKINDNYYLQILSIKHVDVSTGIYGYSFYLSKDESGMEYHTSVDIPKYGITPNTIAAFHFRNSDNSAINQAGPKNVNAPGEIRYFQYGDYRVYIYVLNFEILNAEVGKIPSFNKFEGLIQLRRITN